MSEQQLLLFDQPAVKPKVEVPFDVRDPNALPEEKPRLRGQNLAILLRLQQGDATNHELSQIALKYTSRLSDLRAAGYAVEVIERDTKTGRTLYRLMSSPEKKK